MNTQIYILIGISLLAFLIGHKLKQHYKKSKTKGNNKKKPKGKEQSGLQLSTSKRKEKVKTVFLYIQLFIVFGLLIFMIPALSRDILSNQTGYDEKLILRILIVVFAAYILFMGFLKLMKSRKNNDQ